MALSHEKWKMEERIQLSVFKHRGNVALVSKECDIPYDFAMYVCNKIKKRQDRDVKLLVAGHIVGTLLLGRESRIQYLTTMLNALEGKDSIELSACCKSIRVIKPGDDIPVCLRCGKEANWYIEHQRGIYDLRITLLQELREEDRLMMEFADKFGYTAKGTADNMVYKDERKYININGQGASCLPDKQRLLLEEAGKLSPIERTALINQIRYDVLDQEKKENEDGHKPSA